jgi:hypothetical protein
MRLVLFICLGVGDVEFTMPSYTQVPEGGPIRLRSGQALGHPALLS